MSAFRLILNRQSDADSAGAASEVPAVIAGSVNLLRFSEAIARAGLVGRYDADRGILVIEPASRERQAVIAPDTEAGIAWYNGLTRTERRQWHEFTGSAVPADCWHAFQSGAILPS